MPRALLRFAKYTTVGVSTFLFDLLLLYVATGLLGANYILASGCAFFVAVSINYYFSRRFVFKETHQTLMRGYVNFIGIAGIGAGAVMGLMFVFVQLLGWQYLLARVLVSGIVGMWNYLMNLFFNFKVAGKYD